MKMVFNYIAKRKLENEKTFCSILKRYKNKNEFTSENVIIMEG